ncbi:sulfurtransferase complex subunit TusB [uncultured Neptuniibacter sp.]|uniref:sulfurtransferase complex subunit TusB n=1 Tax=uncultured Neptuniibacter sp. TaxID=502143 RepID=UPI00260571F4|nr:sulfurtransferase complex subunit TusB [uncultured Neptuniibacter sp.]
MTLHILNKSPSADALIKRMLCAIEDGDAIIMIEDGVLGALDAHQGLFSSIPDNVALFALEADLEARGITSRISEQVSIADDKQFVVLCSDMDKTVSWY